MKNIYSCPQCGAKFQITENLLGVRLQCSNCQTVFTVSVDQTEKKSSTQNLFQRTKTFCKKHIKLVIFVAISAILLVFFFFILPGIIHKNIAKTPQVLVLYASYAGTPLQRADACKLLGIRSKNSNERDRYFDRGLVILNDCKETAPVLARKIYLKHRGDISGWISPEGEKLIKLDKGYILRYVNIKYRLNKYTAQDHALLREYEQYMVNRISKEGMRPGLTGALGLFYYNNVFADFPCDWKKAEYYLEKTVEDVRFFSYIIPLLECYALQGKYDKMEYTAEKYINSNLEKDFIGYIAKTLCDVYAACLRYQNTFAKTEKNYEKALKWKQIALEHNPALKLSIDNTLEKAFPEKYQK